MKAFMNEESHILKNGGKRLRHGTYKSVYLDNRGKDRRGVTRYAFRADVQTVTAGGLVRLRRWFRFKEDARRWLEGK